MCQKVENPQNSSCNHLRPLTFVDFKQLPPTPAAHTTEIPTNVLSLARIIKSVGFQKGNTYLVKKTSGFFVFNCQMFTLSDSRLSPPCFPSSPMLKLKIIGKVYWHAWVHTLSSLPTWNLFLLRKNAMLQKLWPREIQGCKCQVKWGIDELCMSRHTRSSGIPSKLHHPWQLWINNILESKKTSYNWSLDLGKHLPPLYFLEMFYVLTYNMVVPI